MNLPYTRAMIHDALNDNLEDVEFETLPIFDLAIPKECPDVPSEILNPINTWTDKDAYFEKANYLANQFNQNFEKYAEYANEEILSGAPKAEAV
jgi:phosphoenolpyruvate carboxykinase (ATP)